jgi:nucleoside-diphosphate-sugar epimerase
MKALIIGGSGGLSGKLASLAKETYEVWVLTRGNRPIGEGITPILSDRNDKEAFRAAILNAGVTWDVVFDCICMNADHAKQDLDILPLVSSRLIVISTDSVYDPSRKMTPQKEEGYFMEEADDSQSYAVNKRKMEKVFLDYFEKTKTESVVAVSKHTPTKNLSVTIFRPGHIYGPGFLLGCYPEHSRQIPLPDLIQNGEPLSLVAGGIYLTQPIFVSDLADTMLNCVDKEASFNEFFCIGGPDAVENRIYYEILGDLLEKPVTIRQLPLTGYVKKHPEYAGHLCHRIYDLSKLEAANVKLPSTPLKQGLCVHLESLGYLNS